MYSYVYKVEFPETGHVYFGSRSCECKPEEDTEYLGSPKTHKAHWKSFEPVKVILREFDTREEANAYEAVLIEWAWSVNKSLSLNANIGGVRFSALGLKKSEESKTKISFKNSKPFKLVSPDGKLIEGSNLRSFSNKKDFSYGNLHSVIKGERLHYKGYTANLEAHQLYLESKELRGIYFKGSIIVVDWKESGIRNYQSFKTLQDAKKFRDKIEIKLNKVFQIQVSNWKQKLEEIKNNGTSPLHEL